jgi:hypothetical protein
MQLFDRTMFSVTVHVRRRNQARLDSLVAQPISANLVRGASMIESFSSRRDSPIVARHEVPE